MIARNGIACMQNNDGKRATRILSCGEHRGLWSTTKVLHDARSTLPAHAHVDETDGTLCAVCCWISRNAASAISTVFFERWFIQKQRTSASA